MASVLLLNLGGPATSGEIYPFLLNLFSDPYIISFPGGRAVRPLFARMIAQLRTPKARRFYARIGGGSPLLHLTLEQREALQEELSRRGFAGTRAEVIMRYTEPRAEAVLASLAARGERRALALPLYPQECRATTGSSLADLEEARRRVAPELRLDSVRSWHLHPLYLDALAERVRTTLSRLSAEESRDAILLFSAHGIPASLERAGDPYVKQIRETMAAVLQRLNGDPTLPGGGARPSRLAFQSRTGPVRWVGPSTDEVIRELSGARAVVVIPISFVSDHIETLYEIDLLYGEMARRAGIGRFLRVESLNSSPLFIRALADLAQPFLEEGNG